MESRRIYLRVKALLRGNNPTINPEEHLHSSLTLALHMEVLESELRLKGDLLYMVAFAALHAHPGADVEKAGPAISTMYIDALQSVPYMVGGSSSEDVVEEDRAAWVKKYKQMFQSEKDQQDT